MIKRRHVLVLALAFCLTLTLFIAISTGYDPWVDLDDDGVIGPDDFSIFAGQYGTSGTPINKTALLLELQSRVEALETRIPKKGYVSVHPAAFNPKTGGMTFRIEGDSLRALFGLGDFFAQVQLPHGAKVVNMTAYLYDHHPSYEVTVWLDMNNLNGTYNLMAGELRSSGAPDYVVLYDDTIDYAEIDNQHHSYDVHVYLDASSPSLMLYGVVIEYEYEA